jgi:hypothetical protein
MNIQSQLESNTISNEDKQKILMEELKEVACILHSSTLSAIL